MLAGSAPGARAGRRGKGVGTVVCKHSLGSSVRSCIGPWAGQVERGVVQQGDAAPLRWGAWDSVVVAGCVGMHTKIWAAARPRGEGDRRSRPAYPRVDSRRREGAGRGVYVLRLLGFFDDFGYAGELAVGPLRGQMQPAGEPDEAEIVQYLDVGHRVTYFMEAGVDVLTGEVHRHTSGCSSLACGYGARTLRTIWRRITCHCPRPSLPACGGCTTRCRTWSVLTLRRSSTSSSRDSDGRRWTRGTPGRFCVHDHELS